MSQRISVYLKDENCHWLKQHSEKTSVSMSALVNMFVAEKRQKDSNYIGNVNRSLENARVADLENQS